MVVLIVIGVVASIILFIIAMTHLEAYIEMLCSENFKKIKEDHLEKIREIENGKYDKEGESYDLVKARCKVANSRRYSWYRNTVGYYGDRYSDFGLKKAVEIGSYKSRKKSLFILTKDKLKERRKNKK